MTNLESDMTFPTYGGEVKPATGATLFALGSWLRRGKASADARQLFLEGGRDGDSFYRDRWSYDKIVRSTHGVNCTGSCSWKIYVKDGVITWETQQTDYPSTGADMPEYEPRGCPRGAAFSWYTYSPTRIRYPYVRSVLLDAFRDARARHDGDAVAAWAEVTGNPETARSYKSARGKGGMVRVGWDEAMEIVAAAYVHTIRAWGPDRIAGFSVIPAMSQVSYGAGGRLHELIGGTMLSFYDWYADLPPASPQVFGDQTDVPEAGDWYNSQYLMMWGSNLPLTRTDAAARRRADDVEAHLGIGMVEDRRDALAFQRVQDAETVVEHRRFSSACVRLAVEPGGAGVKSRSVNAPARRCVAPARCRRRTAGPAR